MPWWWVIPAALGGYYLYKELTEDGDEERAGQAPPLSSSEQQAVLPPPDESPGSRGRTAPAPRALPEWTRHIDPMGLGQFLRTHGPRFFPASWTGRLSQSSVPPLQPAARNRILTSANALFFPLVTTFIALLWWMGRTGKDLFWIVAWGGVIGYSTNWLAIRMLFHPKEKRPLIRWQGVIPSRREEILIRVTDGVCENLISEEIIRKYIESSGFIESLTREHREHVRELMLDPDFRKDFQDLVLGFVARILQSPEFREEVLVVVERRVEEWAGRDFTGKLASLFKGWWRPQLKDELIRILDTLPGVIDQIRVQANRLLDEFPRWIERGGSNLEDILTSVFVGVLERLDIRSVIYHQLNMFSGDKMEEWVTRTARKELQVITLLGGVLGLAGGLVIYAPMNGVYMIAAFGVVFAIDQALLSIGARRRRKASE